MEDDSSPCRKEKEGRKVELEEVEQLTPGIFPAARDYGGTSAAIHGGYLEVMGSEC